MAPVDPEYGDLWEADTKARIDSTVQTARKQVDDNLPVILNSTEGAVMGLSGYQSSIDNAKSSVVGGIDTLQRTTNQVKELNRLASEQIGTLRTKIERTKEEVSRLKETDTKSDQLLALRAEQAAELKTKYASNLHTSWLGLWKPMSGDSYTGLIVASVVFALIALLSLFFLVTRPFRPVVPEGGGVLQAVGGALRKITRVH